MLPRPLRIDVLTDKVNEYYYSVTALSRCTNEAKLGLGNLWPINTKLEKVTLPICVKNEDKFTYRENRVEHASSNIVFLTSLSVDGTRDISHTQS